MVFHSFHPDVTLGGQLSGSGAGRGGEGGRFCACGDAAPSVTTPAGTATISLGGVSGLTGEGVKGHGADLDRAAVIRGAGRRTGDCGYRTGDCGYRTAPER